MKGYDQSCGGLNVLFMDLGEIHLSRFKGPPALSFCPTSTCAPKRLLGHNSPGGLVIDVEVSSRESQGIGCSFDVLLI